MKTLKKILSVLLCLILVFSMAACAGDGTNGETVTENSEAESKKASDKKESDDLPFTADDLYNANLISSLLSAYGSVRIESVSEESRNSSNYFIYDNEPAYILTTTTMNDVEYNGYYNGFQFNKYDGYVTAEILYEYMMDEVTFQPEINIANAFEGCEITLIEEGDDYYEIEVVYGDIDSYKTVFTIDKQSLAVRKEVSTYGGFDQTDTRNFYYGDDTPEKGILDDWKEELKTVTVVYENASTKDRVVTQRDYHLPSDWEPVFYGSGYMYLNEDYTVEYEYPGHGVDFTVYITTAAG